MRDLHGKFDVLPLPLGWMAFVGVFGLICWGMLAPQDPMPKYFGQQDKVEHLVAFMLLGGVSALVISRRGVWLAATFCIVAAIGLEFGQAVFTIQREPSWRDAFASTLGGIAGLSAITTLRAFSRGAARPPFCGFKKRARLK